MYNGRSMSSWERDLDAAQPYQRGAAAKAMGEIGAPAAESIPALIELLEDDDGTVKFQAAEALAKMGAPAVPQLEPLLEEVDPELRLHAATTLLQINPQHEVAQQKLIDSLCAVGQMELAKRAQEQAIRMGAPFVPKIVPLLDDPYLPVRRQAVATLTGMKKDAAAALPQLIALGKKEKDAELRRDIVRALGRIGTKDAVEAPLRAFTDDPDVRVTSTANDMLRYIGATGTATAGEGPAEAAAAADSAHAEKKPLKSMLAE